MQQNIGFSYVFCGIITKNFECVEANNYYNKWAQQIVQTIYTGFLQLWKLRNELVHGETLQEKRHCRQQKVLQELKEIYTKKENINVQEKDLFYESLENHMKQHRFLCQISSWIKMIRPILKEQTGCLKK